MGIVAMPLPVVKLFGVHDLIADDRVKASGRSSGYAIGRWLPGEPKNQKMSRCELKIGSLVTD
jgi:hypothetical protein